MKEQGVNGCSCVQAVRGVIFASGLKRDVFTAGNDIKELYAPQTSKERCVTVRHLLEIVVLAAKSAVPVCEWDFPSAYMELAATETQSRFCLSRYREFWVTSNVFLARLYRSPLVTMAAIKGACPAGGCCLSLCCDVRIMTEQACIWHYPLIAFHLQEKYVTLALTLVL